MKEAKMRCFIDTNLFGYVLDSRDPEKQIAAKKIIYGLAESKTGMISTQTLKEFINIATKKFNYSKSDVAVIIDSLARMFPVYTNNVGTIKQALKISIETQFSFWDSLIIAAASESGCSVLYSEDLNHGQTVNNVKIINPFI